MPDEHARLSPSGASRWIACPASVLMSEKVPREESIYAREGTLAHALAELEAALHFELIDGQVYDQDVSAWMDEAREFGMDDSDIAEVQRHCADYVELLQGFVDETPNSVVLLEQRVQTGIESCWGTSDAVIVSPDVVHIVDLKYGKGVAVSSVENPQLMLYGVGALETYGDLLGEVSTVRMTVFQPRTQYPVGTFDIEPDDLRAWRDSLKPVADEALGLTGNPRFGPSAKTCRWCPAAGDCSERVKTLALEDFGGEVELMSNDEIAELLPRIDDFRQWAQVVEKAALRRAYSEGQEVPGYKVVASRGRRQITDDAAAIQLLIDGGYTAAQVSKVSIRGFGELEKLMGSRGELDYLIGDYIRVSEGQPSLVKESDRRPAISPASEAAQEFGGE